MKKFKSAVVAICGMFVLNIANAAYYDNWPECQPLYTTTPDSIDIGSDLNGSIDDWCPDDVDDTTYVYYNYTEMTVTSCTKCMDWYGNEFATSEQVYPLDDQQCVIRYHDCVCTTVCNNCPNSTTSHDSTGHFTQTTYYTCSCGNCIEQSVSYTCDADYYGTNGNCQSCPTVCNGVQSNSDRGSTDISDCCIDATTGSNNRGSYTLGATCAPAS